MNKKIKVSLFLAIVLIVIGGGAVYLFFHFRHPGYSPESYQRIVKKVGSIYMINDSGDAIVAEFTKDGEFIKQEYEDSSTVTGSQGKLRVFVPKDKGWYTIEYPYPYPLSKTFFRLHVILVKLSALINSIKSGEVTIPYGDESETTVKDIKVTFEPEK